MITVVEQSTAERNNEIEMLFEEIKPLLDNGYSFKLALQEIGRIKENHNISVRNGWLKHLIDYAKTQGYDYNKCKQR